MRTFIRLMLTSMLAVGSVAAQDCPKIAHLPDVNCDGKLTIAVLGDSVVYGTGDAANKGGYVQRTSKLFSAATFINLGIPGLNTRTALLKIKTAFTRKTDTAMKIGLVEADIVVLDLGRNDRWFFGEPLATYRNLQRMSSNIGHNVKTAAGFTPVVVLAVEMLPNRGAQSPWIQDLNALVARGNSKRHPADLHFDHVDKHLLNTDGIHPTAAGYVAIAKVFADYLKKVLPSHFE